MRCAVSLLLAALTVACVDPAVSRYQLSPPTAPSPMPPPTPTPPLALVVRLMVVPSSPVAGVNAAWIATVLPITPIPPVTYAWSFGDGVTRETGGDLTNYTYAQAGTYDAAVTVSDAIGRTTSAAMPVSVIEPPPPPPPPFVPPPPPPPLPPALAAQLSCVAGPVLTLTHCNLTLSFGGVPLSAGTITAVIWNWGDGTVLDNAGTTAVKAHQYGVPGTFTVFATVTATTPDGARTTTTTKTIVVL